MDGVFHGYDELDHERINLDFCWIPLEELRKDTKVYPLELIPYILEQRKETVHFVSRDRKSTRLNSSHASKSRMPSSA